MRQLFGTDGIRAIAGQSPLDHKTIYVIGLALAHSLKQLHPEPKAILGMDTRESGPWIAAAITAGLRDGGATVESAGIITTPAIAYLARLHSFTAGIVISASHNPWRDNGIKIFGGDGYKLPDSVELGIETEIFSRLDSTTFPDFTTLASPQVEPHYRDEYLQFLRSAVPSLNLTGQRLVIDCANGAASSVAPDLFSSFSGDAILTHVAPDGRNINEHCGALHPQVVAAEVVAQNATIGITFDGDADRALFADHTGSVVNGDAVLLLAARDLQAAGQLIHNTIVATTMSNMGLEAALDRSGIRMLRAPVGDKYVLEQMRETGAVLGGEQSGHILFAGRSTTGDGLLTALLLLDILARSGKTLAELKQDLKVFPQVILNVHVREKKPLDQFVTITDTIHAAETELGNRGRVVIRYSGTEALARVMIEAESEDRMRFHADQIANAIRTELGV